MVQNLIYSERGQMTRQLRSPLFQFLGRQGPFPEFARALSLVLAAALVGPGSIPASAWRFTLLPNLSLLGLVHGKP
jgi:hypothetical protein